MNIVGENFPKEIVDQINLRQTKLGSSHRDNELLSWMNSKTGWVRLVSSVDVNKDINPRKVLDGLRGDGESALAEQYVLFGGVTKYTPNTKEGATIKQRSGITRDGSVHNMGAYGLGGLDYGLSPMPGIVSANIKTENRGSLRTSIISIKAYNRKQFDIIDLLYLRLGYTVLLEWGHSMFYTNEGKLQTDVDGKATLESLFLTGKDKTGALINYNSLLPIIDKRRKELFGNYDAVLGKVVNYSWTVNKDLSYDITLTVRSVGDVIESLKMNTSLGGTIITNTTEDNTTESSTTPKTDKETIEAFKNKNTMAEYFYSFIENGKTGRDIRFLSFKNGESNSDDKIYYIRLGHLLDWIHDNIVPSIRNKNGSTSNGKVIKINTDSKTNIICLEQRQIITDPRICVFKTTIFNPIEGLFPVIPFLNGFSTNFSSIELCPDFEEGEDLVNDNRYLYLMNVYFSMSWILSKMDSIMDDEGNVLFLNFLQSLCNGFEEATCYYNRLTPTVNDIGEITFIDEIGLPDRDNILARPDFFDKAVQTTGDGENLAKFNMFGYKESGGQASFIRDFSMKTEIPASFATMITVGAQACGLVVGEDATCLSKMNYGLTDRMKPEIIDADIDPTVSEDQQLISKFLEKTFPIIPVVNNFLNTVYQQNTLDPKVIDSMKNIGKDLVKLNKTIDSITQAIKKEPPTSSPGHGFIPFNLQLTMDGLSGFKIYQKYTAEQEFLPTNYPESLDFIIKGITHTIQNNQWTTVIESLGMPKITKGSGHIKVSAAAASTQLAKNIAIVAPAIASTPNLTSYDSNSTPRLRKAVLDQSTFVFDKFKETPGQCGAYSYSIARYLKTYLDKNSNTAIPIDIIGQSGGNANEDSHRAGIMALGIYDQHYLGSFLASTLKAGYFNTLKWNYGDILNYYSPDNSPGHNMHSQIYTGDIWNAGMNNDGKINACKNSKWTTSTKTNYGSPFVYGKVGSYMFKVYAFKIKKQYLV